MKLFGLTVLALTALLNCSGAFAQAANGDLRALGLARRAELLLAGQGGQPFAGDIPFKLRGQLLSEAAALEAADAALSPYARAQLERALAELESLTVERSLLPRTVLANGTVTGLVRDATTGLPISVANSIRIQATNFSTQLIPSGAGIVNNAGINANGEYTLSLPPGSYHLRTLAGAPNSSAYIPQAFGFGNCVDSALCPRYVGNVVTVPDAGVATANFDMPIGARISGNLKRQDTLANVANVNVVARPESGGMATNAITDAAGNYTLAGLAPGRYRVATAGNVPAGFLHVVYPNVPCGDVDCDSVPGSTLVTVAGTATTSGIDLLIGSGAGSLSGKITKAGSGDPVVDAGDGRSLVFLISEDRATVAQRFLSAPDGSYQFQRLRPGNYRVVAVAPDLIGKLVLGISPTITTRDCNEPTLCDALDTGGAVVIAPGAQLTNINLALDAGASVSGVVRTAVGAVPIANATVTIGNSVDGSTALTDAAGAFTVRGLAPGVYYASVDALPQNFVQTWLGDVACRGFACINVGMPITLAANAALTGVNFNMPVGGTLSGVISDALTGLVAPRQARLELFTASSRTAVVQVFSNGAGYSATGLPPGAYKAVFASESVLGWVDTAFGGLPCPRGSCDLALLPTLAVSAGSTTTGVDGSLPRGPLISGRITDATSGLPIRSPAFGATFSNLLAFNNNVSNYAGFARVSPAGTYLSRTGLSPDAYFLSTFLLRNNVSIGGGYVDQIYNNLACPFGSCGLASGTAINLAGSNLTGFDIALQRGGAISGTVTRAANATPLFGVELRAFNAAGKTVATARSNPNGKFRLEGLPAGSYFVNTSNALGFQDALYSGQICEPFCNPVTGTPIVVNGAATTSGRDFALLQSVAIAGVVSDGAPAPNVPVELYGQIGNLLGQVVSGAGGGYRFDGLTPGRFYLRTRNATGRTDDLYWQAGNPQNTSLTKPACVGEACQVRQGTPIDVLEGSNFNSANLALLPPGTLSGQVSRAGSGAALSGVALQLLDARGVQVATLSSNANGNYSFSALGAGNYYLVSRGTPGSIDVAYPSAACPASCNGLNGAAIAVGLGLSVTGINLSLASGGTISGSVRSNASNLPIPGVTVQIYNSAGLSVAQIATNMSGAYALPSLPNGQFFVRTQNTLGYVNEVYNNRACGAYCDVLNGTAVTINAGNVVGQIDFALDPGGSISGRISNALTSSGIALAEVQALDINGLIAARASSNASGNFTIGGLPHGSYKLRTSNSAGYINQLYRIPNALPCSPTACPLTAGTPIVVAGAVTGINLALGVGGTISGTAADLFNNPLPSGTATLLDAAGFQVLSQPISQGNFEFNGLANGSYYVLIRNSSGLIDLLFPNVPCPGGACNVLALGTPIVLNAARRLGPSAAVADIDLRMASGRAISGRVTEGALPRADVTVYFFNSTGVVVASGISDALGNYTLSGTLPAGPGISYFAATATPAARGAQGGLINKAWNNLPCMQDCGIASIGTPIALPAGVLALPNIDFNLSQGGGLRGQVRDGQGAGLALVSVEVVDSAGRLVGSTQSDSLGSYQLDGLIPGNYFARTRNVLGLPDQVFGSGACVAPCNPLIGTPISVVGTSVTGTIDFALVLSDVLLRNGFE